MSLLLAGCGSPTSAEPKPSVGALAGRLDALDEAASIWAEADTVVQFRAGAEAARNLVTGPFVTGYGDGDGDGDIRGDTMIGLLPGGRGIGQSGRPDPDRWHSLIPSIDAAD